MNVTLTNTAMASCSCGTRHCGSRSPRSRCSLQLQLLGRKPLTKLSIELIPLGADDVIRFDIDAGASIGQLCAEFKNAAFDKFKSHDFFDLHKYGAIIDIRPGSTSRIFKLSDVDHEFMNNDDIPQDQCIYTGRPLQFQLLRLKHSWTNPSNRSAKVMKTWCSSSLQEIIETCKEVKHEFPTIAGLEHIHRHVGELPWHAIAMQIANNIDRRGELLDSAQAIMDYATLRTYTKLWTSECQFVKKVISWEVFKHESAAKDMILLSTPGGYLADFMFMLVSIERKKLKRTCTWATVFNCVYEELGRVLEIHHPVYCRANNIGNTMQVLMWLAYEQQKYTFIISIIHHAANLQWI